MPVKKINIEEFLLLAETHVVIDVRSPGEYTQAHIPGAGNLALFSDEERKNVGTAYKQQSRETAIKIGLDYFGSKMRGMVEAAEKMITDYGLRMTNDASVSTSNPQSVTRNPSTILVHCWRGGMRSMAVAWLLDLYGFNVYTLAGGYKRYRNWVLEQFTKDYRFNIIGGYTGSGKTLLLHELEKAGYTGIDLEALANHKGSALGGLGKGTQPRGEMFENLLAGELSRKEKAPVLFIEDESQRIGDIQIPTTLWYTIRKSPVLFFDIPFEERLNYLTAEYGTQSKEKLVNAIMRIQKRLGGLETKNAIGFLLEDNFKESFRILLKYYDKYYLKGLHNRENAKELIKTIPVEKVNAEDNTRLILQNLSVFAS